MPRFFFIGHSRSCQRQHQPSLLLSTWDDETADHYQQHCTDGSRAFVLGQKHCFPCLELLCKFLSNLHPSRHNVDPNRLALPDDAFAQAL